jgi:hypothetical protein
VVPAGMYQMKAGIQQTSQVDAVDDTVPVLRDCAQSYETKVDDIWTRSLTIKAHYALNIE